VLGARIAGDCSEQATVPSRWLFRREETVGFLREPELILAAVVNRVLPWRNEMSTIVPLLSHKGRTHWLRIAFTGVVRSLVRRAISPAVFAAAEALAGYGQKAIRRGIGLAGGWGSAAAGWCLLANINKGKGRQGKRRMNARAFENSKLHGRHATEGPARAPRRFPDIGRMLSNGGHLNADALAVGGTTVGQHLENVKCGWDQEVVDRVDHPMSATGEVVELQGFRALEGASGKFAGVKIAGVKDAGMTRRQFRGSRVFDCEADRLRAVEGRALRHGGDLVMAGRGLRARLAAAAGRYGQRGDGKVVVSEAGRCMRRNAGKAPANPNQSGTLQKYADRVGPARTGAVWHAGSKAEVVGHADI